MCRRVQKQYSRHRARTPESRSPRLRADDRTRIDRSWERSPRPRNGDNQTIINTISGGFGGGGPSHLARKRHMRAIKSMHMISRQPKRSMPDIIFTDQDFKNIDT